MIDMSKRLQVVLRDAEYEELQRVAFARRMTLAEWVRQALDQARRKEPLGDAGAKLDAIRAAARHQFPTADVEAMNLEIAAGYRSLPTA